MQIQNLELWAVVNNAGIATTGFFELLSVEDFKHVFEVNFFGTIRVTKAFLPLLRETKGRLFTMSSLAAKEPGFLFSAYGASKAALLNLDQVLRRELDVFGVQVITILPGFFRTKLTAAETHEAVFRKQLHNLSKPLHDAYAGRLAAPLIAVKFSVNSWLNSAVTLRNPEIFYTPQRAVFQLAAWIWFTLVPAEFGYLSLKIGIAMLSAIEPLLARSGRLKKLLFVLKEAES